jgi:hypothetical protein
MNKDWIKLANDPNFGLINLFSLESHGKDKSEKCSQDRMAKKANNVKIDCDDAHSFQNPRGQKGQNGQNPQLGAKTASSAVKTAPISAPLKRSKTVKIPNWRLELVRAPNWSQGIRGDGSRSALRSMNSTPAWTAIRQTCGLSSSGSIILLDITEKRNG